LRRTAGSDWSLHQEGSFAPDDGRQRYMPSIAMNADGAIGLGYNFSSTEDYAGIAITGRTAGDPLGEMTVEETIIVEGQAAINSGGRFADYSQMSVAEDDGEFWFTGEYAGSGSSVSTTRIAAFTVERKDFDLTVDRLVSPETSATLGATETVSIQVTNVGINPIGNFAVGVELNGVELEAIPVVNELLMADNSTIVTFNQTADLSQMGTYSFKAYVNSSQDENFANDSLVVEVLQLPALAASMTGQVGALDCSGTVSPSLEITNNGSNQITEATIIATVNGTTIDPIFHNTALDYLETETFTVDITENLVVGTNDFTFTLVSINGESPQASGNPVSLQMEQLPPGEFVTIQITGDTYPEEITWVLLDQNDGSQVASGALTPNMPNANLDVCLDLERCYDLVVSDSYGDGLCCAFGQGNFGVLSNEGTVLVANNGEFASQVTESFCPSDAPSCSISAIVAVGVPTGGDNNDGTISLEASGGVPPYTYSIDGGESTQATPIFEDLGPGVYDVWVTDSEEVCVYTETVGLIASGIDDLFDQSVEVLISPNPTNGVFNIQIRNFDLDEYQLDVNIYDASGKLLQHRIIGKYNGEFIGQFSLLDYPSGQYYVRFSDKNAAHIEKIVRY